MTHAGPLLRAARERRGLTLRDVADQLGVSFPTVSRWERGARAMTEEQIEDYAAAIGLEAVTLLVPSTFDDEDRAYLYRVIRLATGVPRGRARQAVVDMLGHLADE